MKVFYLFDLQCSILNILQVTCFALTVCNIWNQLNIYQIRRSLETHKARFERVPRGENRSCPSLQVGQSYINFMYWINASSMWSSQCQVHLTWWLTCLCISRLKVCTKITVASKADIRFIMIIIVDTNMQKLKKFHTCQTTAYTYVVYRSISAPLTLIFSNPCNKFALTIFKMTSNLLICLTHNYYGNKLFAI